MTITNHLLAGAVIGLTITSPMVALPVAFASHFVMDALPHFGYKGNQGFGEALKHKLSYIFGAATALTTVLVVAQLITNSLWLALLAGLVACLPDAVGVYNYARYERRDRQAGRFIQLFHIRFHRAIQQYERPWGIYVEGGVFFTLLVALAEFIY